VWERNRQVTSLRNKLFFLYLSLSVSSSVCYNSFLPLVHFFLTCHAYFSFVPYFINLFHLFHKFFSAYLYFILHFLSYFLVVSLNLYLGILYVDL
jgi:hypothetical protein